MGGERTLIATAEKAGRFVQRATRTGRGKQSRQRCSTGFREGFRQDSLGCKADSEGPSVQAPAETVPGSEKPGSRLAAPTRRRNVQPSPERGRLMKLSLIVLTPGKSEGQAIPINLSQFVIGRDAQCHLRPASALISKRHCAVLVRGDKAFVRD